MIIRRNKENSQLIKKRRCYKTKGKQKPNNCKKYSYPTRRKKGAIKHPRQRANSIRGHTTLSSKRYQSRYSSKPRLPVRPRGKSHAMILAEALSPKVGTPVKPGYVWSPLPDPSPGIRRWWNSGSSTGPSGAGPQGRQLHFTLWTDDCMILSGGDEETWWDTQVAVCANPLIPSHIWHPRHLKVSIIVYTTTSANKLTFIDLLILLSQYGSLVEVK